MAPIILNAVCFQIVWFICVGLRMPWAVPAAVLSIAIWYALVRPDLQAVMRLLTVIVAGIVVDSALTASGVFGFNESWNTQGAGSDVAQWLCPPWLMCLWVGFATTVGVSLRPLISRLPLAVVIGALFGPLAYYVGSRLGAVSFGYSLATSLAVLAVVWGLFLPFANAVINRSRRT